MIKVFIAPRRYVQGVGVLRDIGKYVAPLGKRALVVWGPKVSQVFADSVGKSFAEKSRLAAGLIRPAVNSARS
jgi:glycerol dehydrogenase